MDDNLTLPPPAELLRESFGDRRPPDITRKITACVACRKQKVSKLEILDMVDSEKMKANIQKIKCHMQNSQPPCTRCKKRGLPCTVNRSLQMLLEDDAT